MLSVTTIATPHRGRKLCLTRGTYIAKWFFQQDRPLPTILLKQLVVSLSLNSNDHHDIIFMLNIKADGYRPLCPYWIYSRMAVVTGRLSNH